MARVIGIQIKVEGTDEQNKQLRGLQRRIDQLKKSIQDLEAQRRKSKTVSKETSDQLAKERTELKANVSARNQLEREIVKQTDAVRNATNATKESTAETKKAETAAQKAARAKKEEAAAQKKLNEELEELPKEIKSEVQVKGTKEQIGQLNRLATSVDKIKLRLRELSKVEARNKGLTATQTAERTKLRTELRANQNAYRDLEASILKQNDALRKNSGFVNGISDGLKQFTTRIVGTTTVIFGLTRAVRDAGRIVASFDEGLADVRKTTQSTKEEARELSKTIARIDTRTSVNQLLKLATAGGRLGLRGQELIDFTEQTDKAFVALGDSLDGSAEDIGLSLGKIAANFGLEEQFGIGEAIEKVGSGLNELGARTKATEGNILDFTNRLAGIAIQANITLPEVLALGALFDASGQSMEIAATTFNKLLPDIGKDVARFAQVAGQDVEEFSKLLEERPIEALQAIAIGSQSPRKGIIGLTETLRGYGIESSRATQITGILSGKVDELKKNIIIANKAVSENTSISEEAAIKNETLSAKVEKLDKTYTNFILSLDDGSGIISKVAILTIERLELALDNLTIASDLAGAAIRGDLDKSIGELFLSGKEAKDELKSFKDELKGVGNAGLTEEGKISVFTGNIELLTKQLQESKKGYKEATESSNGYFETIKNNIKASKSLGVPIAGPLLAVRDALLLAKEDQIGYAQAIALTEQKLRIAKEAYTNYTEKVKESGDETQIAAIKAAEAEKVLTDIGNLTNLQLIREIKLLKERGKLTDEEKQKQSLLNDEFDRRSTRIPEIKKEIEELGQLQLLQSEEGVKASQRQIQALEAELKALLDIRDAQVFADIEKVKSRGLTIGQIDIIEAKALASQRKRDERKRQEEEKERNRRGKIIDAEFNELNKARAADVEAFVEGEQTKTEALRIEQEKRRELVSQFLDLSLQQLDNFIKISQVVREKGLESELAALESQRSKELAAFQGTEDERKQIDVKFARDAEQLRRDSAKKEKEIAIAQIIIQGAIAVSKTIAELGGVGAITPLGAALIAGTIATTAAQVAVVNAQEFEQGGLIQGPSHADGGVPFTVNGAPGFEAEGGEVIINKRSVQMFGRELSAINVAGGGKAFAKGGPVAPIKYQGGGLVPTVASNAEVIARQAEISTASLVEGVRGVIADEVGSLEVINVATQTADTANQVQNIENDSIFG